jgi:selenocysteine lyase/cysteine desulfurase
MSDNVDVNLIEPLVRGGTGSRSEFEKQPNELPDRYESGTPNGVGIAGLGAGARWVMQRGIGRIRAHEIELTQSLIDGLGAIQGVIVHGTRNATQCTAVVSMTLEGREVSEIGWRLDEEFGILSRVGLHCAPAAHRTIGTFPKGTVRLAPSVFTTQAEIQTTLDVIRRIAQ